MPCLDQSGSLSTSDIVRIRAEVGSGLTSAFHVRFLMEPHSVAMRMTRKVRPPELCLGMSRNSAASMPRCTGRFDAGKGFRGPNSCRQGCVLTFAVCVTRDAGASRSGVPNVRSNSACAVKRSVAEV